MSHAPAQTPTVGLVPDGLLAGGGAVVRRGLARAVETADRVVKQ